MKWPLILMILLLTACNKWVVPDDLVGTWYAPAGPVAVRTHSKEEGFKFYKDTASAILIISKDKTVSGRIGSSAFRDAELKKNFGPPKMTGIAWIVDVGPVGYIHPKDPLPQKEVQFWLPPAGDTMDAELRYTQNGAQFPMAGMIFSRMDQAE